MREAAERITLVDDPAEIIRRSVTIARFGAQEYGDVFELMLTMRHDDPGAEAATQAEDSFRGGQVVARLAELDALPGSAGQAVDVLAYFLGCPSWRRLVVDFGWTHPAAESWLTERLLEAFGIHKGQ